MDQKQDIFDKAASNYDHTFTNSSIGKAQRQRVYHWLEKSGWYDQATQIFEINCGTGFDAEHFHQKGIKVKATDGSSEMIKTAKIIRSNEIQFEVCSFSDVDETNFQGNALFSNFGGLNCISERELGVFLAKISNLQKKGDKIALVIMPRFCFHEGLYFFFKLHWKKLFRRTNKSGVKVNVDGVEVHTYYHSPKKVVSFLKDYHTHYKKPVAYCLPPSYLEPFYSKRPKLLSFINKLERVFGRLSFLSGWSDHYIIIGEKK